jgi:hypothetical protein
MKDVVIFYDHLVYFKAIWYSLWPVCIFCGKLVYFSRFGIMYKEKSGNPAELREKIFCPWRKDNTLAVNFSSLWPVHRN